MRKRTGSSAVTTTIAFRARGKKNQQPTAFKKCTNIDKSAICISPAAANDIAS